MVRCKPLFAALLVTAGALYGAPPARADFAHLTLQSQPGDFVGQGGSFDVTYTPDNTLPGFFQAQVGAFLVGGQPAFLHFIFVLNANPDEQATLDFGTNQLGIPIQPGTYNNAERASFASPGHAGLDVSFEHRGNNTLTGSFTINSLTLVPDATALNGFRITEFSASFEQHGEGGIPALFGTFEFSTGPTPTAVPGPASLALLAPGALGLLGYASRRRKPTA
jgi:hypothetical protein